MELDPLLPYTGHAHPRFSPEPLANSPGTAATCPGRLLRATTPAHRCEAGSLCTSRPKRSLLLFRALEVEHSVGLRGNCHWDAGQHEIRGQQVFWVNSGTSLILTEADEFGGRGVSQRQSHVWSAYDMMDYKHQSYLLRPSGQLFN